MSEQVKRYWLESFIDDFYKARQFVLASDFDALAQRCREREEAEQKAAFRQQSDESAYSVVIQQNDALRAEVERLTGCLKRANSQAEHFEREWYLRGDEAEQLERIARHLVRAYIVSDDAYDPEAATDKAMARLKEQIK